MTVPAPDVYPSPWGSIYDLEAFIGATDDGRLSDDLAASIAWCQRMRPDLVTTAVPDAGVLKAVLTYAGLLFRERSTPAGFATYEDLDTGAPDPAGAMTNVYRLLGSRRPAAR
jgi:hypothetical protein